jgi:hypothetical protein
MRSLAPTGLREKFDSESQWTEKAKLNDGPDATPAGMYMSIYRGDLAMADLPPALEAVI